tara:strand:+ start:18720 stop:19361 length:642 start_codon:yes stop_codon:yes gene_type:complete
MHTAVTIIDYGIGNLRSVISAFDHLNIEVSLASKPSEVLNANRLILPGVGAFGDAAKELRSKDLNKVIIEFINDKKPFLGICVGMQLMLSASEEFGSHAGLDIISGNVTRIPTTPLIEGPHKVPHVGWNALSISKQKNINYEFFKGIDDGDSTYFVHSYMGIPTDEANVLAGVDYNGYRIPAVIGRNDCFGCQFHPEKSGPVGLQFLKNFASL